MRVFTLFFALLMGCSAGCTALGGDWVELQGTRYSVEIADDDASRARGLMFRDAMADDAGMFFIHDRTEYLAYWMRNTRIPLDILYFDEGLRLVSQQRDVPPCLSGVGCPTYPSAAPARFVLELNAGQAARLSLEDGALLELGPAVEARRRGKADDAAP